MGEAAHALLVGGRGEAVVQAQAHQPQLSGPQGGAPAPQAGQRWAAGLIAAEHAE
ncbi:hypothetical protein [Streptomyces sp. NPDC017958]|uniref:hypothetical protein n=1 Tax=Streptomyces sp. NPDC017958 TaxID=3365021 RepID=UPI003797CF24